MALELHNRPYPTPTLKPKPYRVVFAVIGDVIGDASVCASSGGHI